jgi:hypothetical protein
VQTIEAGKMISGAPGRVFARCLGLH